MTKRLKKKGAAKAAAPSKRRGRVKLGPNPKDILGMAKVSLSKIPPSAQIYEALAMMDGARKYGAYNWRENKVIASIYVDACKRHIDAWFDGESNAADSGIPHLGHARACLGIIVDALESGNLIDDRPLPGPAAALIKRYTQPSKKTRKKQ